MSTARDAATRILILVRLAGGSMTKSQRLLSLGLAGVALAVALYFTFTNTAWRLIGCPEQDYPEIAFAYLFTPAALMAFIPASLGQGKAALIASVTLSSLCLVLTVILVWPTGGNCQ
jgi:hypothetical protein